MLFLRQVNHWGTSAKVRECRKLLLGICAQAVLVLEEGKSKAGERSCGCMSEHKSGCVGELGTNPSAGDTEGWDLLGVAGAPTASVCP